MDHVRQRRQREMQQAQQQGLRRRHASEERQNALVERMASLTQGAREEEAEQEGRSSAHRPARFSNTYALSGTPGELLGGASRVRGGGGSGRVRSRRGADIDEAIAHGMDEHFDLHGDDEPEEFRRYAQPPGGMFGPMMSGGDLGAMMMGGAGGADELLGMLLRSRESFLDQAEEMQMAMAMSLSLQDQGGSPAGAGGENMDAMSYENLVELEDVRVTVPEDVVKTFPLTIYDASAAHDEVESKCAICQIEYTDAEDLMGLPCQHSFHPECASEWLTKYSKNCPMCKTSAWEPK
mmetsp:Transcript_5194/g.13247  ORF Transcript_5194/g.13247 Transcript_5194/m.13247 type:complete len:294 (+) Transcript_5194:549-1430(+)